MRAAIARLRYLAAAALAVFALAACSHAPSGERPVANRGAAVAIDAAVAPPDAESDCVAACVQARQMEAVSIEHIRRTCATQCSQPPPALPAHP